jgi:hypothetical protein
MMAKIKRVRIAQPVKLQRLFEAAKAAYDKNKRVPKFSEIDAESGGVFPTTRVNRKEKKEEQRGERDASSRLFLYSLLNDEENEKLRAMFNGFSEASGIGVQMTDDEKREAREEVAQEFDLSEVGIADEDDETADETAK